MALEVGTFISDLNASNPVDATDLVNQGDDHLRLVKSCILNTFPNVTGAMTKTHTELNNALIKTDATAQELATSLFVLDRSDDIAARFMARNAVGGFELRVDATSGLVRLFQTNSVGAVEDTWFQGNRNGSFNTYFNNVRRTSTGDASANEAFAVFGDNAAPNAVGRQYLAIRSEAGASRVLIGKLNSAYTTIRTADDEIRLEVANGLRGFTAESGSDATMYYNNAPSIRTQVDGAAVAGLSDVLLSLWNANFVQRRAYIFATASGALSVANDVNGGEVSIQGRESGGTLRNLIRSTPGGPTRLAFAAVSDILETTANGFDIRRPVGENAIANWRINEVVEGVVLATTSAVYLRGGAGNQARVEGDNGGNIGLVVSASSATDNLLYGGGDIVLRLKASAVANSRAEVRDESGTDRPIGYNVLPLITSTGGTLADNSCGERIDITGAGSVTVPTGLADNYTVVITNNHTSAISILEGSGAGLRWYTGSDKVAGNRTLARGGVCTIAKRGNTNIYDIWGVGLS